MTPEYHYFVVLFTFTSETLHIMLGAVLELLKCFGKLLSPFERYSFHSSIETCGLSCKPIFTYNVGILGDGWSIFVRCHSISIKDLAKVVKVKYNEKIITLFYQTLNDVCTGVGRA